MEPRVRPEDVKPRLDDRGVLLIDVRRRPNHEHIPGSVRIEPEDLLLADHILLPGGLEQRIVAYCTCPDEATSASVAEKLRALGYRHASALKGGMEGWRRAHYPLLSRGLQRNVSIKG